MVALKAMGGLGPLLTLAVFITLLTLAPLAVADGSPTSIDATDRCPYHVVLFQFDSFRWQKETNPSTSAETFLLQVTATSTCENDFPEDTLLLMNVILVFTSEKHVLINVYGYGSITNQTMTLYFPVDIETIDFHREVYYAVFATFDTGTPPAGYEWERDIVKEWQPYEMNAAAKFAMKVSPSVIKSYHLEPFNLTRLSHIGNLTLDYCKPAINEEACYFVTADQVDVCVTQTFDETDGDYDILICDDTVQSVTVNETTNLDHVQLRYPEGEVGKSVNVIQTNPTTTLELYQYFSDDDSYEPCDDVPGSRSARCYLTLSTSSNENYTFRMVELDGSGSPTSSREVLVQDFNVTTRGISSDTAQVTWDSDTGGQFEVTISPAMEATYSGKVVNCPETTCDFFFIGLQEDWTLYMTSVRKVIGDVFTSEVVNSLQGPPEVIPGDEPHITTLNHYTDNGTIHTEACFESISVAPNSARLLLIDSTGLFVQSEDFVNVTNDIYCFESVVVTGEFITSSQTRILVDFKANNQTHITQMDIFLFTPNFHQVSTTSARATWRNLNWAEFFTLRAPGHKDQKQQLECSYTGDECYYYVNEDQKEGGNFSLQETSEKLIQTSTVVLEMQKIPQDLAIVTPFNVRYDNRLRVCFDAVPNVDHYELGVELLGELVSSNQDAPIEIVSTKTCAVSSKPVTLGAYEEIWAVVVGYDKNGTILTAGEGQYKDTFLSLNSFVLAVTSVSEGNVTLRASWYILDDTSQFKYYVINLMDANVDTPPGMKVPITETMHEFPIIKDGLYSVCVSVINPSGTPSDQTCSDIITVKLNTDFPDPAPQVANVTYFFTKNRNVRLSWDRPEDASALLVSWRNVTQRHLAKNERLHHTIGTPRNSAFTQRKTEARESSLLGSEGEAFSSRKADVPLLQARSLQDFNDQISRVVLTDITEDGFTLVPASQSFVDIPITTGTWNICVSAVKNHQAGMDFCLPSMTVPDTSTDVSPPTDLTISDDGVLSWLQPTDTPAEGDSYTYYIECARGSESLSFTTNSTSLDLGGLVEAGEWNGAVYSATIKELILSEGQTIVIVLNGIKVTYEQTGNRDVTLSWEETSGSYAEEERTYNVTLEDVDLVTTTCSRVKGCSVTFVHVTANPSQELDVTIVSPDRKEEFQIYFLDIGIVPANKLSRLLNANGSATVTWECLEGVSFYNVSLVDKDDVVLFYDQQTLPCSYTFAEASLTTLQEDTVLLQACLNTPSAVRCDDPQRLSLGPDVPTPSSNVLVIVLSSVAAGLLLVLMVAGIVYKLRSDKAKRTQGDDDASDGEGSVHSLRRNSGSQHSVEPPAAQPTLAVHADITRGSQMSAQNPPQAPIQRQTPVLYRSAAPAPRSVPQTQPSNGTFELNISARQNPEAARAPISSVNPNVRYNGPPQRNVLGNPSNQRVPQVGNPPPQRLSGPPGLAANPNVRAAGPPRTNFPAGPPRMNNAPSGPTTFAGQPRNPPQGARMNPQPYSQPIEVVGRFSRAPISTRPTHMSPTRAPAPRPTGLQMSGSPTRYPPAGQRFAPGPSSPIRLQAPPSGLRPIPRVGGGGGYVDMRPTSPGLRQTRSDARQFSPERSGRQPQPQNTRGQVRNYPDTNRPNDDERVF